MNKSFINDARMNAAMAVTTQQPVSSFEREPFAQPITYFGCRVFDDKTMRAHLPKAVYKSLRKTIDQGQRLDPALADVVACAMKDWAMSHGATHYCHVFYPLTGLTAEKHDSFLAPDGNGGALAEFSGSMLAQGEADGSSLPSGGLRSTFEARGYTAWDVTSPAYLMENAGGIVLCIPTAFLSWTGLALDKKTPLLRSAQALNQHAQRVLKLFGVQSRLPVVSYCGLEQEYFLVDRNFVFARPDLLIAGRTIMGARPAKGQEFADQYYGVIPSRVLKFMMEVEHELYKLGVPVKTRHNEAAPCQYEIAPTFETANLATDHNQLVMMVLRKVAKLNGMVCLLHEKPFHGINGSGKHINYSLGNSDLGNLFDPGETPHENAQFLVFLCAMIRAVHKYSGFLRASVATASNDLRLGAHEAPPAIMSMFLGDQLTDVLEQFRIGQVKGSRKKRIMNVGVDTLPALPADAGDRNRTSPFAFVGNRFEFRALGSGMSAADTQVVLNTIMAESLDFAATFLERHLGGDLAKLGAAVQRFIEETMEEHSAVIFNGDGYSHIWHEEAARRGLPNLRTTPEALPVYTSPEVMELCQRYKVFTKPELRARQDIYLEQYCKTVSTEAHLALNMARTMVYPAAMRYQTELAASCTAMAALGVPTKSAMLEEVSRLITALEKAIHTLESNLEPKKGSGILSQARFHCDSTLPAMEEVRRCADALESIVAADLWPLPSYQEMLFVK